MCRESGSALRDQVKVKEMKRLFPMIVKWLGQMLSKKVAYLHCLKLQVDDDLNSH